MYTLRVIRKELVKEALNHRKLERADDPNSNYLFRAICRAKKNAYLGALEILRLNGCYE